jgi:transcriptional regulator with XRE-family HTH domain
MSLYGDAARRQQFGKALRELRRAAGLTGVELAARLNIGQASVSRLETGHQLPSPEQVDRWAQATNATRPQQAELHRLAETAATEAVSWGRRSLASMQRDTANIEASTGLIRGYHPLLVHALLQVPDYTHAVYRTRASIAGQTDAEVARAVTARMAKQAILHTPGHRFEFLMAEAGLRWRFVPAEIMAVQLERIAQAATMPNVLVGILPMEVAAPVWRWGGFSVFLERSDGEDLALVESLAGGVTERGPADLALYARAWKQLLGYAVTGEEAVTLLERIAGDVQAWER